MYDMYERKSVGNWGESVACEYLINNNYNIIEKNFSCKQGEIDIVAFDKLQKEIVFVEVKTRTNFNYGLPSEAVTKIKKQHIKNCIEYYIFIRKLENYFIRVDVIEIVINKGKYKLNHLKNVF